MSNLNPDVYPVDVFLFRDEKGIDHIYKDDPINPENSATEIKNFCEAMYIFMRRRPTRQNPILCRMKLYSVKNRTMDFSPEQIVRANKRGDIHFMDKDGNVVLMMDYMNRDPHYSYNGTVFNTNGDMIESRAYSATGECSDGDPDHSVFVVGGPVPLKKNN